MCSLDHRRTVIVIVALLFGVSWAAIAPVRAAASGGRTAARSVAVSAPVRAREKAIESAAAEAERLSSADSCGRALPYYQRLDSLLRSSAGTRTSLARAQCLEGMGRCLSAVGACDEARPRFEKALALRSARAPKGNDESAWTHQALALCLEQGGQYEAALRHLRTAIAISHRLHPDGTDAYLASYLADAGRVLSQMNDEARQQEGLRMSIAAVSQLRRVPAADTTVSVARALVNVSASLSSAGKLTAATDTLETALALFRKDFAGEDSEEIAAALEKLAYWRYELVTGKEFKAGDSLIVRRLWESSLASAESALAMRKRMPRETRDQMLTLAYAELTLATIEQAASRPGDALAHADSALAGILRIEAPPPDDCGKLYLMQGDCLCDLGLMQEADVAYRSAAQYLDAVEGGEAEEHRAALLGNHSTALGMLGLHAQALKKARASLEIYEKGGAPPDRVANALDVVGFRLRGLGDTRGGLSFHRRARDLRLQPGSGAPSDAIAIGDVNIGRCLLEFGHPDSTREGIVFLQWALERRMAARPDGRSEGIARVFDYLGDAQFSLGQRDSAESFYRRGLEIRREVHGGDRHPDVARSLAHLAGCLASLGRVSEALECYARAYELLRDSPDRFLCAIPFAELCEAQGDTASAARYYREATAGLEMRRQDLAELDEFTRARYFHSVHSGEAYAGLFRTLVAAGHPADAVTALESGRARSVLELLARNKLDQWSDARRRADEGGQSELVARMDRTAKEWRSVERDIAVVDNRHRRAATAADADVLMRQLRRLRERQQALAQERQSQISEAKSLDMIDTKSATMLCAMLQKGEGLLLYALGPSRSYAVRLAHGDTIDIQELRWPDGTAVTESAMDSSIILFRRLLLADAGQWDGTVSTVRSVRVIHRSEANAPGSSQAMLALGARLRQGLVPEAMWSRIRSLDRVFVIPHGALHELPFEALVTTPDSLGRERYWLDDGPPVAYAPSGSVLSNCRQSIRQTSRRERVLPLQALLLGDPAFSRDGPDSSGSSAVRGAEDDVRLAALPGTRVEVDSIRNAIESAIASRHAVRAAPAVRTLTGLEANYDSLFVHAPRARWLHLATHGLTDEEDPRLFSRLALAAPAADSALGVLRLTTLLESWQGRLQSCELVVLSACDTGRGLLDRDEGVLALPIGFLSAGAPAVVVTEWPVHDERTAQLMASFYRRLAADSHGDRLVALRDAKREMRARRSQPYYWAAFLFMGAPD